MKVIKWIKKFEEWDSITLQRNINAIGQLSIGIVQEFEELDLINDLMQRELKKKVVK